jgi:hypothetical protein
MNSCGSPPICFWLALLGADRDWPVEYSSRIDGYLLPLHDEQSHNAL